MYFGVINFVHIAAPLLYAVPPCASSKTKGPNITQPVYATTTRDTSAVHPSNAVDSVYALAAKSEYMQHGLLQNTVSVPPNFPSSDVPLRELGNRTSTTSTEGDVARNRLSEMALFSPRPGDGVGFLASDPLAKSTAMYATPPVVSKAKAATLAPNRLPDCSAGLEYRSHTNVATYGGRYQQSQGRLQISNGCMSASAAGRGLPSNTLTPGLSRIRDFTPDPLPAILDRDSAARDEGYGVLHMPPPIDRSTKPFQQPPPTIDRGLKPVGQSVDPNSSDSSEGGLDPDELPAYTKLAEEDSGGRGEDAGETQFNVAEIPRVTLRTTKYTQVDFDPHIRRPVPLPRKRSSLPAMTPKPSQRINYTDVDIVATNQLSDHLNRQMTVRGAEQKALAEKHYVNVDRSGSVDDETDPDYYTHMRVSKMHTSIKDLHS